MDSAKLNDRMQVVGIFAVVASLIFVGLQMRQTHRISLSQIPFFVNGLTLGCARNFERSCWASSLSYKKNRRSKLRSVSVRRESGRRRFPLGGGLSPMDLFGQRESGS